MTCIAQRLLVSLMLAAGAIAAAAADFPSKPVHMVLAVAPGGTIDTTTRLIATNLRETWGQPVIIENRPGGNSSIGIDYVAKSAPDGYTVLVHSMNIMIRPHLQRMPYDVIRDLVGVVQIATLNFVLVVSPKSGISTVGELVALAKKNPGRLNYASAGNGSATHMYTELLRNAAKIDLTQIPYKGDAAALQGLLGGQVDLIFSTTSALLRHVKSGKVRALMATGSKPLEGLENVPLMETVYPGISVDAWIGMFAPAATPKAIVDQIAADVRAAVLSSEVSSRIRGMGFVPTGTASERFGEIGRRDYERWGQIIRENNIRPD